MTPEGCRSQTVALQGSQLKGDMTMITKTQLRETVERLQRAGFDIAIHWAYGRPRCTSKDEARDLSPRLSTGEMCLWLDGFETGANQQWEKQNGKSFAASPATVYPVGGSLGL